MIFSFYSYKGGVGRTVLLVHTGIRLASMRRQKGYRVLLIDMDLEAPGLDVYFPLEDKKNLLGFTGLIKGYQENERREKWLKENLENERFITKVPETENLFVMPSGIRAHFLNKENNKHKYSDVVGALERELSLIASMTSSQPREGFFHDLANLLRKEFTYVLIDSRSGLAEQAYASTLLLADTLIPCFRLNRVNIEGVEIVLGNFLLRHNKCLGAPDVPVIPVATPIPPRGGIDVEKWISVAEEALIGRNKLLEEAKESDSEKPVSDKPAFTQVERIFFEPNLEIGERLVFNFDGNFKEGFSGQTPFVASIYSLANRVSALNCDKDAIAAREMEIRYYNEDSNYHKALEYLGKQIRLEPFNDNHWDNLGRYYADRRELHLHTKKFLTDLISDWRGDMGISELRKNLTKVKRLVYALYSWISNFGKDQPEAGFASAEECLSLSLGDEHLEERSHIVFGQVIDELVKKRKSVKYIRNERIQKELTLESANKHYSKAIELSLKNSQKGGRALIYRARNLKELNKYEEALADYDRRVVETAAKKGKEIRDSLIKILSEEGEVLEYLGRYEWAFQTYRAVYVKRPTNTDIINSLYNMCRVLELDKFGEEIAIKWEREEPRNAVIHRLKAITYLTQAEYKKALMEIQLANQYSALTRMGILEAIIQMLQDNFDDACNIMQNVINVQKDEYNQAIYAIALILAGKEDVREYIQGYGDKEPEIRTLPLLASLNLKLAQEILRQAKPEESDVFGCIFYKFLKIICAALSLQDTTEYLQNIIDLFSNRPFLPVVFRNHPEVLLLRLICKRLLDDRRLTEQQIGPIEAVWKLVDSAKGPKLRDLPPRKLYKPLPFVKVENAPLRKK